VNGGCSQAWFFMIEFRGSGPGPPRNHTLAISQRFPQSFLYFIWSKPNSQLFGPSQGKCRGPQLAKAWALRNTIGCGQAANEGVRCVCAKLFHGKKGRGSVSWQCGSVSGSFLAPCPAGMYPGNGWCTLGGLSTKAQRFANDGIMHDCLESTAAFVTLNT
jgi:hypothetical protein